MAHITVDIDLDEFSNSDIFQEFNSRISSYKLENLNEREINILKKTIVDFKKLFANNNVVISHQSLEDALKIDLVKEALNKYSLTELEEKLK